MTGKEDASEVCREVIGECRPRFLCILGGRYGWVPPPKRIAADAFAALLSGASAAGALTETEKKYLLALYTLAESGGEFRLQKKPDTKDAREVYGAQCKAAVLALRRARLALSITADEIDFGVLNPPSNDHGPVRAFFFFRHEATTARMVEEKAGDFCERIGSDAAHDLAELKKTIADSGHTPRIYGEEAQWDATTKRLARLGKFGESVFADLFQSLKDDPKLAERFSPEAEAARNETSDQRTFADEAEAMDAFIDERTERFVTGSRDPLLRDLLTFATTDGAQNLLVLTGDPGSGKSALLAKFCRSLAEQTPEIHNSSFILHHFVGASSGSTDLRRTLRRLCHALAPAEPLPQDLKELIAHFHALLAGTKQRVILVLDALNQLDTTDGAHWLNWLPPVGKLPPHIRIIASVITPAAGEEEHGTLAILRYRKDADIRNLQALSWRDTVRIMRGYLRRFSKRMDKPQKRALLAKPAGRLPLYILTALEELRTLGTDEQLVALASQPLFPPEELERLRHEDHDAILTKFIATELPGTAVELFRWILKTRLSKEPILATHLYGGAAGLVEKFAACLGVSRHGLSPAELAALLDPGDPLGNVAALLRLLRPYLMRRGELLDFYHGQFREAVTRAYLPTDHLQRATRFTLADYFAKQPTNRRQLDELPWQLMKSRQWKRLHKALGQPHLFREIAQLSIGDLQHYWGVLTANHDVNLAHTFRWAIRLPWFFEPNFLYALQRVLDLGGDARHSLKLATHLTKRSKGFDPAGRSELLFQAAVGNFKNGLNQQARHSFQEILEMTKHNVTPSIRGGCLENLGFISMFSGDYPQALNYHKRAEAEFRSVAGEVGEHMSLYN